jgi:hypothetical protein
MNGATRAAARFRPPERRETDARELPRDGMTVSWQALRFFSRDWFSLYLRYPACATDGITVSVNGSAQNVTAAPGEFLSLHREWRDGDTVVFKAPLTLRYEIVCPGGQGIKRHVSGT